MKSKTIFGALLVSAALCSQGFGFELLNGLLGLKDGGCGEGKACAKVAPCEACKACPAPCAKVACCEKACPKACEAACEPACGKAGRCKKQYPTPVRDAICKATPVRDLFGGLKDLYECKGCTCSTNACEAAKGCCPEPACEPACEKAKKCRKVRCEKGACKACEAPKACEVACCEKACPKACEAACEAACEPTCEKAKKCHKLYRRPVLELLEGLFGQPCKAKCGCGECGGCEAACAVGCDGAAPAQKAAPATAPAKAPEQAAPLPAAPKADPSASIQNRGIYQASSSLVRN